MGEKFVKENVLDECPKCKEQGLMIEKSYALSGLTIGGKRLMELFCNVCSHSWTVLERVE
jgi:hypothetical protein